jgi:hypothetical protein
MLLETGLPEQVMEDDSLHQEAALLTEAAPSSIETGQERESTNKPP